MDFLPKYLVDDNFKKGEQYLIKLRYGVEIRILVRSLLTDNVQFDVDFFTKFCNLLLEEIHKLTTNRRKRVNILYYQVYNEKLLPKKKGEILTCNEVNSGLCYMHSSEDETNIIIHRKEEFFKVLIHEMLHLYDLIPHDLELDRQIENMYQMKVNTNEACVELNALILNNIIIFRMYDIPLKELMKRELVWSLKKVKQLLDHFDIITLHEVGKKWKESTNAFAYYVLKTFLLISVYEYTFDKLSNENLFEGYDIYGKLLMTINDVENMKFT